MLTAPPGGLGQAPARLGFLRAERAPAPQEHGLALYAQQPASLEHYGDPRLDPDLVELVYREARDPGC